MKKKQMPPCMSAQTQNTSFCLQNVIEDTSLQDSLSWKQLRVRHSFQSPCLRKLNMIREEAKQCRVGLIMMLLMKE